MNKEGLNMFFILESAVDIFRDVAGICDRYGLCFD